MLWLLEAAKPPLLQLLLEVCRKKCTFRSGTLRNYSNNSIQSRRDWEGAQRKFPTPKTVAFTPEALFSASGGGQIKFLVSAFAGLTERILSAMASKSREGLNSMSE